MALASLQPQPSVSAPVRSLPPVENGDWVFRLGPSRESRLIQQVGGGDYSHIGMIVSTSPQALVAHATTDDDPERPDQVLLSPLTEFVDPRHARAFAIARPDFLDAEQRLQVSAAVRDEVGQPFLLEPRNLAHRYCTTLLADAIRMQHPGFAPQWQRLDLPVFHGEYLFPRAFAEYPGITWLYRYSIVE